MENRYKLILSNKNIYKEVELPIELQEIKIGTTFGCDIRLRNDLFFENFELSLEKNNHMWQILCTDGIYISSGGSDIRKIRNKSLEHSDNFILKYEESDGDLLNLSYTVDFEYENKNYERLIDLSNIASFTIGCAVFCNVILKGSFVTNDFVELTFSGQELVVSEKQSTYGVYHNGKRIKGDTLIKDRDFISIANFSFYYKDRMLYTSKYSDLMINGLSYHDTGREKGVLFYPKFNRNTRIKAILHTDKIQILDPPSKPQKPKKNIISSLLPAISMLVLTVLIRGIMSDSTGTYIVFSICTMGMGIVTSIISIFQNDKDYKTEVADRDKKYREYIANKSSEIESYRNKELNILNGTYLETKKNIEAVREFSGTLFDRVPDDDDFICVRLGTGYVKAKRKIEYKKQERFEADDELAAFPEQLAIGYKEIANAPVIVDLKKCRALGVIGSQNERYNLLKNMTLDLCIRQYYKDVKLLFVMNENQINQFSWVRLLPHVQNEDMQMRNIVCDDDSKTTIFEYLYKELSYRETHKEIKHIRFIVFIFDEMGLKCHPVSKFIEKADGLNITFIFFESAKELLPLNCTNIIMVMRQGQAVITESSDGSVADVFTYDTIDDASAEAVAVKLAPVYCEEVSLESTLTKNISLFELLNIFSVEDINLSQKWATSQVYKSMSAPLGVKTKNEIVCLDLHEKAHGPHGLVAGTTGSGKSEILQSYILSMATLYHPYDVCFVIIDFKGGGMVNQFKTLPHLVGAITNIDGKEIERSLQSIKAELEKRQRLFADAEVNHIDLYIRKFRTKEVSIPIPHLIIIVDEFAELKAEQPEFMKELISAARIGRSLGVHLILATQKPSGQVNEQIWSNSKFKLCLKVQTKEDSSEVIKSPLAAEIKEPGRTYFQVGNNEIFELFQSAYSGSSAKADDGSRSKSFAINEVSLSGKRRNIYHQKVSKTDEQTFTQLEAIVDYVSKHCKNKNIEKLPNICLPSLSKLIDYPSEVLKSVKTEITVDVGIYDAPATQYQGIASFGLGTQNVVLIGSSQYGKTNLLQTIIRELSSKYTPDDVSIYIIDFGSMVLKNFENIHHVGGVVCPSEDEKMKNLFKLLNTEIATRKDKLMSVGVSSFASYKEAEYKDIPQIVLMIDNYTALKELYLQEDDVLLPILRDGLAVGISVVIANSQTAGLGYRYMANLAQRISLFCNDSGEYSSVFDHCRLSPDNVVGRGLIELNRSIYEFQAYLSFMGEKEIDRVLNMRNYVESINANFKDKRAKKIPQIPALLTEDELISGYKINRKDSYTVPVALEYDSITTFNINLLKQPVLGIIGREKSGKNNLLSVIFNQLHRNIFTTPTEMYLIDDVERKLKQFESLGYVKAYTMDRDELFEYINEIYVEIKERSKKVSEEGVQALKDDSLKLIVIRNMDVIAAFSKNTDTMKKYKEMITQYRNLKICFIFVDIEDAPVAFSGPEILKLMKETKNFIYFNDLSEIKFCDVSNATQRLFKKEISRGDAYYFSGNEVKKIKTVKYNGGK